DGSDDDLTKNGFLDFGKIWVILNGGQMNVDTESGVASVSGSYMSVEKTADGVSITCLEGTCVLGEGDNKIVLTEGQTAKVTGVYGLLEDDGPMTDEEVQAWLENNPEAAFVIGSVGNFVWQDLNANGFQDDGEEGIAEVYVALYNQNEEKVAETFTDENGFYEFANLAGGGYKLKFELPAGYVFTLPDVGEDNSTDSDAGLDGLTAMFEIAPGQDVQSLDAGLILSHGGFSDVCPLTGLKVKDPSKLKLRPLFLSISHFPANATRPLTGISWSPIVFELYIGYGQTRLFSMFYCDYPDELAEDNNGTGTRIDGVRSGRVAYADIASQFGAGMIIGGADPKVGKQIAGQVCGSAYRPEGSDDIGAGGLDITRLEGVAEDCQSEFGNTDLAVNIFGPPPAGGQSGENLLMFYNQSNKTRWDYNSGFGGYVRSQNHPDTPDVFEVSIDKLTGAPIVFENVVVLYTQHTVQNSAGTIIDIAIGYQQGKAKLFRNGIVYDICWSTQNGDYKEPSNRLRPILFTDCDGNLVPLSPGKTWVNLVDYSAGFSYNNELGSWVARFYQPEYQGSN
ncbi:MAG: DUF3048 C-terminal domain-containing protein, partial [Chloroflexota bacterium]